MKLSVIEGGNRGVFKPVVIDGESRLLSLIKETGYSLGTFKNNHRTVENFEGAELIGLDFDGGFTLEEATEAFKDEWHIIGTTRSHGIPKKDAPACDRFRVILKAETPIDSAADYKATVQELMSKYPAADRACSDASRYFEPCIDIVCTNTEGRLRPVVKYVKPAVQSKTVAPYMKGELSKQTLTFLAFGTESNWNDALFKAALDLHEQQYTQEEAITALTGATRNYLGNLDETDLKTIESAFNRDPKYPPRKVESMFNFKKVTDMSSAPDQLPWLTDGLLIEGGLGLLVGPSKAGKSTIVRQLSQAVSRGGEWLGRKSKKGTVLYLALEEQEQMLAYQLKNIGIEDSDEIYYHTGAPAFGDLKDNLTQAINKYNAALVVVDTMVLLAGFENLNDYDDVYKKLSLIRNIARETNAHILLIHHTNKSGSALGSTAIMGAVDCFITFSEIQGCPRFRKLESKGRGGRQFNNQRLEYIEGEDIYRTVDSPIDSDMTF